MKYLINLLERIYSKMFIQGGFEQEERIAILKVIKMLEDGGYR